MSEYRRAYDDAFLQDCMRIHQQWHERAISRDTEGLLALYAKEAVLETRSSHGQPPTLPGYSSMCYTRAAIPGCLYSRDKLEGD